MADNELDRLLVQVRRIEEHREKGAEAEIRKTYQKLLQELRHYLADTYSQYAEEDRLDYGILQTHGYYARFLEEVEQKINDISPEVRRTIRSTVEQTYEYTYNGMVECVKNAVMNPEITAGLKGCTPDIIRRAVENPISKLTLNDRLEKHRKEIIYDIKQDISVGLMNGDRYSTMANRIKKSVEGDYKKAIRIARTETHRVREAGNHDASVSVNEALKNSTAGVQMVKTWRTMKDERVRPNHRYKTKKGWKNGKPGKYDHKRMEGITIPVEEEFILPSGAKTMAPGQSGVAGEDINCRCYLSYSLQKVSESDKINTSKKLEFEPAKTIKEANEYAKNVLEVNAEYKGLDIRCVNEWNRGLTNMKQKFPELFKEKICFVGESHERNEAVKQFLYEKQLKVLKAMGYTDTGAEDGAKKYATSFIRQYLAVGKNEMASSWTPGGEYSKFSGICMNKGFFKDFDEAIRSKKYQVSVKWKPKGTATIKGTFDHEFGHQLDAWLGVGKQPNIQKLFDDRENVASITDELSEYAWNNGNKNKYAEMIAEGWTEYCNNPEPRPMAAEIGKTIERLYEEWKKKNL